MLTHGKWAVVYVTLQCCFGHQPKLDVGSNHDITMCCPDGCHEISHCWSMHHDAADLGHITSLKSIFLVNLQCL